jgi:hypothetical protein
MLCHWFWFFRLFLCSSFCHYTCTCPFLDKFIWLMNHTFSFWLNWHLFPVLLLDSLAAISAIVFSCFPHDFDILCLVTTMKYTYKHIHYFLSIEQLVLCTHTYSSEQYTHISGRSWGWKMPFMKMWMQSRMFFFITPRLACYSKTSHATLKGAMLMIQVIPCPWYYQLLPVFGVRASAFATMWKIPLVICIG